MKNILGLIVAAILVITFLANVGPMIALAFTLLLCYVSLKQYKKADTTGWKIFWIILGGIFIIASVSNVPALVGILALYILYVLYQSWKDGKEVPSSEEINDPFVNFEKEWMELKNDYKPNNY